MSVRLSRYFASTLSFLLLAVLIPVYMVIDLDRFAVDSNVILSLFILAYVSLQFSVLIARNLERILEMTFWVFTYIFMGIVPFVQLIGGRFPWIGIYSREEIAKCLLIVVLGIVCYQIGLVLGRRKQDRAAAEPLYEKDIRISTATFILLSIACIALSFFLIYKGSGFQALFLPRNDVQNQYEIKSIGLLIDQFAKEPICVCLVAGLLLWKKQRLTHIYGKLMVLLLIPINLIVSNPISNARYWFGSVALTLLLLAVPWKRIGYLGWTYGYLSIFLLIFPYADIFRNKLDATLKLQKVTDFMMDKGDYDAFQMILNTSQYNQLFGLMPGRQLLSTLFFWVPRSVWPDKPYSSGQEIGQALGYKFTNLSCPLWAESYVNFGFAGVVIIFIAFGYVTYVLQRNYMRSKYGGDLTVSQLLVPFLSAFQVFVLRGDLQNAVTYLSVYLILVYTFEFAGKHRTRLAPTQVPRRRLV